MSGRNSNNNSAYRGGYFSSRRHGNPSSYHTSSTAYHSHPPGQYELEHDTYASPGSANWHQGRRNLDRRPSPDYGEFVVHDPDPEPESGTRASSPAPAPPSSSLRAKSRSKSPSPAPPPRAPSPTYLRTSHLPSEPLPPAAAPRKLLILDLNGTLLIRSPHAGGRSAYRWANGHPPPPRLRPTHPRPYMPAFRNYLFHPETHAWLDVMVWSSAQPHSVDDMVRRCFGERRRELRAVWARDTLGLSGDQYHKKTQTTKDLAKPWAHFASLPTQPASSRSRSSSIASSRPSSPAPASEPDGVHPPATHVHSARTTLLLDDSPRKAHLQPYNHVCIREYDASLRRADLEVLHAAREEERARKEDEEERARNDDGEQRARNDDGEQRARKRDDEAGVPGEADGDAKARSPSPSPSPSRSPSLSPAPDRKRKRKKRKPIPALREGQTYDATLLAVVGVLDAVRAESNVAGWIRRGGLWGPRRGEIGGGGGEGEGEEEEGGEGGKQASGAPIIAASESSESADSPDAKRQKLRGLSRSASQAEEAGGAKGEGQAVKAGNDADSPVVDEPAGGASDLAGKMWFEDARVMEYWAERGRAALERLGIPVEHGVES